MRVLIISAYHGETIEVIRRCHDSVLNQTHAADHLLIGDGKCHVLIDDWNCQHVKLPEAHSDYGDTPRAIGSVMAFAQGYDALCWLDADNWIEPDHVHNLVHVSDGNVVTMPRMLRWPDGRVLGLCSESDGDNFNDTNCYFVPRQYMHLGTGWAYKDSDPAVGDRFVWATFKAGAPLIRSDPPTVNYTTTIAMHYLQRNLVPPPQAKVLVKTRPDQPFVAMPYLMYLQMVNK